MEPRPQSSRADITDFGLSSLAFAAGATDVMAFLTLGGVLTAAMTGNMALLGIAVSRADWASATQSLSALFGFVIGVIVAAMLYGSEPGHARQWRAVRSLLLLEVAGLAVFAVAWAFVDHPLGGAAIYCLILLSAFCMGIQSVAARHINVPGVNTIVFTITLVGVVARWAGGAAGKSGGAPAHFSAARQLAVVAAYAVGALVAAILMWRSHATIPWVPLAAVAVAFVCYELARGRAEVRS